jgi:hypothetical protein
METHRLKNPKYEHHSISCSSVSAWRCCSPPTRSHSLQSVWWRPGRTAAQPPRCYGTASGQRRVVRQGQGCGCGARGSAGGCVVCLCLCLCLRLGSAWCAGLPVSLIHP